MRRIMLIICALLTATPAYAVWSLPEKEDRFEEDVFVADPRLNYEQFLYDDLVQDAIVHGHATELAEVCTNFEMRFRKSDGKLLVRRVGRCEE